MCLWTGCDKVRKKGVNNRKIEFSFIREREDWERNRFMGEIKGIFRTC